MTQKERRELADWIVAYAEKKGYDFMACGILDIMFVIQVLDEQGYIRDEDT